MSIDKRNFDTAAATWDENPGRIKLAADLAAAISGHVPLNTAMDVLDFGCGTGLVTLRLASLVGSMTGVDSSRGMIEVLAAKIAEQNLGNVRLLHLDLDQGDALPAAAYDVIVSNMTLHHIQRVEPLLDRFYGALAASGYLCLGDLDSDDGQFHTDNQGVFHFGFERRELRRSLMKAGFTDIEDTTAAEVVRTARNGALRRFSVFLMIGRKMKTA
ncbi:MAG: class I SAM-dependent methyltransferase [Deltaproteobacteria bacterium]|nr:class I SAM-dependent methyltransferase [Deltaproteobacteria bacterium]